MPLSTAILDMVQKYDRNTGERAPDADELNRRKLEQDKAQAAKDFQDIIDDWRTTEGVSALLPRSQSLRQARSRTGYHNR